MIRVIQTACHDRLWCWYCERKSRPDELWMKDEEGNDIHKACMERRVEDSCPFCNPEVPGGENMSEEQYQTYLREHIDELCKDCNLYEFARFFFREEVKTCPETGIHG